ncbi:hypothetical protein D7Y42_02610 [Stenotrophomonas maltophilia]|nr:hypothetical protein [Stenotrophomonas maltophilia]
MHRAGRRLARPAARRSRGLQSATTRPSGTRLPAPAEASPGPLPAPRPRPSFVTPAGPRSVPGHRLTGCSSPPNPPSPHLPHPTRHRP